MRNFLLLTSFFLLLGIACTTSPLGRKQLIVVPDNQMDQMGGTAFNEMKASTPIDQDPGNNAFVRCVALPVTEASKGQTPVDKWEIVVFQEKTANAFALPGGKIGVHTGILPVTKTDAQLASVLGHEVGHVIAKHGAERVSEGAVQQLGMGVIDAFILGGNKNPQEKNLIMGLLGLTVTGALVLPHSRTQESEADLIGLDLMAQAGFDPRQSVELWKNMAAAAGGKAPPEWLSTHPANETRINNLQAHMPEAMKKYELARASGKSPSCNR